MIEYPPSFPSVARAKVEHAIAEAEMSFARDRRSVVNFVLEIFEVFVREFTEVVDRQPKRLSAERFRLDTQQVLSGLIAHAAAEKPPWAPRGGRRSASSLLPGRITYHDFSEGTDLHTFTARVRQELGQRTFWENHQHNIQLLADGEASGVGSTDVEVVEPAPQQSSDVAWEDVTMRFTDKRTVQMTIRGRLQPPQSYKDLGFTDRKTKKPNFAWKALQELARLDGTLDSPPERCKWACDRRALQKRMAELRQILREALKTDADPVQFVRGIGYQTVFKFDPGSDLDP